MGNKVKTLFLYGIVICGLIFLTKGYYALAQTSDYASSKETLQIRYTGYIQFIPSYTTTSTSGYNLTANKHVKRAYVNYTRDGKSVTTNGGRLYTATAKTSSSNAVYAATAYAWDAFTLSKDEKYVTHFYYGWQYF